MPGIEIAYTKETGKLLDNKKIKPPTKFIQSMRQDTAPNKKVSETTTTTCDKCPREMIYTIISHCYIHSEISLFHTISKSLNVCDVVFSEEDFVRNEKEPYLSITEAVERSEERN